MKNYYGNLNVASDIKICSLFVHIFKIKDPQLVGTSQLCVSCY